MALQYQIVPENDFSRGIDARSAENLIETGFVQDLLNGEVIERRVRKRPGYQGHAGNVPVRVITAESTDSDNQICLTLDASIDLSQVRPSPLVIYGRLDSSVATMGSGTFNPTTDVGRYYSSFTNTLRKTMAVGTGTIVVPGTEHGLGTANVFVGISESSSSVNTSNSEINVNGINVDESSYDITISYINGTGAAKDVFIYYLDKDAAAGEVYVTAGTGSSVSIAAATHNLNNFNIIAKCLLDNGTTRDIVIPDSITINSSTGQVDITFSVSINYVIILSAAPAENYASNTIAAGATGTITISDPTGSFLFTGLYEVSGSSLSMILPDTIVYDFTNDVFTITIVNGTATAKTFGLFYEYGETRSNQICVTDPLVTANITSSTPQLTVWGLDHSEIYGSSKTNRQGWTNHIDSYRRSVEERVVCGLGGNLFGSYLSDEVSTSYKLASSRPNLRYTVDGQQAIGPLFWETGYSPARTRGYITAGDSASNWARVTAVSYNSSTGYTDYTISLPNKQILNSSGSPTSLSSVISTTTNLEDWLTIEDMSYSRYNGTFRIRGVSDGVDQIVVSVENDEVTTSDYDDSGVCGMAGVFTDQIDFTASTNYLPGDILISSLFGDVLELTVLSTSTDKIIVSGAVDLVIIGGGLQIPAQRTSSVIPVRSTDNFVRGDMLSYTSIGRLLRVLYINPNSDINVTVSGDGQTATITLGSGDTTSFTVGMNIALARAGVYSGTQTITEITSGTTVTFSSSETDTSVSGVLIGHTLHIDESLELEDTNNDSTSLEVVRRWIPLEAPDDSWDLTPNTHTRYFHAEDYDDQSFLRSTMVVNNMYFTNGRDEVYKFDGANIYRAGLFPWQPGCFIQKDTNQTAEIVTSLRSIATTAVGAALGRATLTNVADSGAIPIGSTVRLSGSTQHYTIREYSNDGTDYYILFDRALDASVTAGTVSEVGTYRYYFRLNAVDANNNIIASAITGSQDHVVELTENAAIRIRLIGLPTWDVYDYDRLEVEIYRTKQSVLIPFYRITTLQMQFDSDNGYLDFVDSFADDDLTELDQVSTALKGAELGTTWSDALRAKYVTSIGNSLVLANVKDYPQLDIQIVADGAVTTGTYDGDTLTFRRSNTGTGTITDMLNTAVYQWVNNSAAVTVSGITGSAGVSFSVNAVAHGFTTAGQWVYLYYNTTNDADTTDRPLQHAGWWQIASITDVDNFVIHFDNASAGAATTFPDRLVFSSTNRLNIPVLITTDGNMGMVNGNSSLVTFNAMRRMSIAINASMRKVDTAISGFSTFTPWLVARGGNDLTPSGRLLVRQPRSEDNTIELKLGTFSGYSLFVNDVRRSSGDEISATTRLYPSRILVSYENYPEIFDNPTSILDSESDSAIDINSSDGQELTGAVPFFGEAAFTAAQQSAILVAFKSNSIYLVDVNEKRQGRNPVQRIETEGIGCTAPYSIAVTKQGIIFANESGIYCLRRDLSVHYIGRYMERNWLEQVDRDYLNIVHGHHYAVGRQYKISIPLTEESTSTYVKNSEVYVYDHTMEQEGQTGPWSRFNNHSATGWANLNKDAYFSSTEGRVFSIRRLGDDTDYRDDSSAIDFKLTTRSNDFGNSGIRKVLDRVLVNYRVGANNTGTTVSASVDLHEEFRETTPFTITKNTELTGVDDIVQKAVSTVIHNTDRRRGVYHQVQIENSTLDEGLEIAGMNYKVAGLNDKGILQAARTRSTTT